METPSTKRQSSPPPPLIKPKRQEFVSLYRASLGQPLCTLVQPYIMTARDRYANQLRFSSVLGKGSATGDNVSLATSTGYCSFLHGLAWEVFLIFSSQCLHTQNQLSIKQLNPLILFWRGLWCPSDPTQREVYFTWRYSGRLVRLQQSSLFFTYLRRFCSFHWSCSLLLNLFRFLRMRWFSLHFLCFCFMGLQKGKVGSRWHQGPKMVFLNNPQVAETCMSSGLWKRGGRTSAQQQEVPWFLSALYVGKVY